LLFAVFNAIGSSRSGFKASDPVREPRFIEGGDGILKPSLINHHDLFAACSDIIWLLCLDSVKK
jgi:hypothetical protein